MHAPHSLGVLATMMKAAELVLLGHAFGGGLPGLVTGAKLFIPLWLIGAALNMWIGVRQAGYSVTEEFPIFLGILAFRRSSLASCGGSFPDRRGAD